MHFQNALAGVYSQKLECIVRRKKPKRNVVKYGDNEYRKFLPCDIDDPLRCFANPTLIISWKAVVLAHVLRRQKRWTTARFHVGVYLYNDFRAELAFDFIWSVMCDIAWRNTFVHLNCVKCSKWYSMQCIVQYSRSGDLYSVFRFAVVFQMPFQKH